MHPFIKLTILCALTLCSPIIIAKRLDKVVGHMEDFTFDVYKDVKATNNAQLKHVSAHKYFGKVFFLYRRNRLFHRLIVYSRKFGTKTVEIQCQQDRGGQRYVLKQLFHFSSFFFSIFFFFSL